MCTVYSTDITVTVWTILIDSFCFDELVQSLQSCTPLVSVALWSSFFTEFCLFIADREGKRNRKRNADAMNGEDEDLADFEKRPRSQFSNGNDSGQRMKMLLPIKDQGRIIPQMMHMKENDASDVEKDDEEPGKCAL